MEIKISITKENKTQVLRLISELVGVEATVKDQSKTEMVDNKIPVVNNEKETSDCSAYFSISDEFPKDYISKPTIQESTVGSWYMFNSYFASKAILRVLLNMIKETRGPVKTTQLLNTFFKASKQSGLLTYRGFPKERGVTRYKNSNVNKLRYFILAPLAEMGLISIHNIGNKDENIGITKQGLELAQLENPKLDYEGDALLSDKEILYLRSYLKNIDSLGYKENSTLYGLYDYIKGSNSVSHDDIVNWFAKNPVVIDYIYKDSRAEKAKQSKNSERFQEQMEKAARAFASGKIALLRELEIIENKRGSYRIINSFE